jgi:hypothetical protein
VEYQFNPGGKLTPWATFASTAAWWPQYPPKSTTDGENYGDVAGVATTYAPATVSVNKVTYPVSNNLITYGGITLVKAGRTTADYPFGYADVHTDGSNYGTAGNPYTAEGGFGDGFDLSWAVDASGAPVNLPNGIKFVRIYTASVLDPKDETHTTFQLPDVFGEISTEVLGVYVTANTGSGNITADPTVMVGGNTLADLVADEAATVETIGTVTYYDASEYSSVYFETEATITASAPAGTSVYINSDTSGSMPFDFSVKSIIARIIAKDASTGIPSIIVIKLA